MFKMVETVIKNLFSHPSTVRYPSEEKVVDNDVRGRITGIDIEKCILCGICEKKCPSNAIKVDRNNKTWELNNFKCCVCHFCVEVCPKKCISMDNRHKSPEYEKSMVKVKKEEGDKAG